MKSTKNKPGKRILSSARVLFYDQGYSATGINQIIQDSGTVKATFYSSYSSKEKLALKVLRSYQAEFLKWMRKIIRESDTPEKFITLIHKDIRIELKKKNLYRRGCPIAILSVHFPETEKEMRLVFQKSVKDWEFLISKLIREWESKRLILQKGNEILTSKMMLCSFQGALMMWNLTQDLSYIDALKEELKRIII